MKLWLLRHARVLVKPGVCYGVSNVASDPDSTAKAAKDFASRPAQDCLLWVSPSERANQLAQALKVLRPDLQGPVIDDRLQEMNFGCWEMQPWELIPRDAMDAWTSEFAYHRFGGVECAQDVINRVSCALSSAYQTNAPEMVWVTHAGVIRAAQFLKRTQKNSIISSPSDWPSSAPEMGQWLCLNLDL